MPQSFVDVIDLLIPELRRRGTFWDGYEFPDGTLRENLYGIKGQNLPPDDHPASRYLWKAPAEGEGEEEEQRPEKLPFRSFGAANGGGAAPAANGVGGVKAEVKGANGGQGHHAPAAGYVPAWVDDGFDPVAMQLG